MYNIIVMINNVHLFLYEKKADRPFCFTCYLTLYFLAIIYWKKRPMSNSLILFARRKTGKIKIRFILHVLKMRSEVEYKESIILNLRVDFSA